MNYRHAALFFCSALFTFSLVACGAPAAEPVGIPVTEESVELGQAVYAQNCAACHGSNLEGQPNWKQLDENGIYPAPPHDETGHTWHHSDFHLKERILYGTAGLEPAFQAASTMPAYEGVLTEEEIDAVIAFLKSTWTGDEAQRQREATLRDLQQSQ